MPKGQINSKRHELWVIQAGNPQLIAVTNRKDAAVRFCRSCLLPAWVYGPGSQYQNALCEAWLAARAVDINANQWIGREVTIKFETPSIRIIREVQVVMRRESYGNGTNIQWRVGLKFRINNWHRWVSEDMVEVTPETIGLLLR